MHQPMSAHIATFFDFEMAREDTPAFSALMRDIQGIARGLGGPPTAIFSLDISYEAGVRGLISSEEVYPAIARDPFLSTWAELMVAGRWRNCNDETVYAYLRRGRIEGNHGELSHLAFGALSFVNTFSTFARAFDREAVSVSGTLLSPIIAPFFGEQRTSARDMDPRDEPIDWSDVLPRSPVIYRRDTGKEYEKEPFEQSMAARIELVRAFRATASDN